MVCFLLEGVPADGHCRNEETHQQLNNNKSSTTLGERYEMCHEVTAKTSFVGGNNGFLLVLNSIGTYLYKCSHK